MIFCHILGRSVLLTDLLLEYIFIFNNNLLNFKYGGFMSKYYRLFFIPTFVVIFVMMGSTFSYAFVGFDQLNASITTSYNGGDEYYWQQEVRVGKSGQLVGMDVSLADLARQYNYKDDTQEWEIGPNEEAEGAGWATFSVFQGAGWHTPVATDVNYVAPLFVSDRVYAGDVCESWFSSEGCQAEWVNIDLTSAGLFFNEGDFFTFQLQGGPGYKGLATDLGSGAWNDSIINFGGNQGDLYDDGISYYQILPFAEPNVRSDWDLAFRTYVDYDETGGNNAVPEPATMFLLGSGLVGFAIRKRKV